MVVDKRQGNILVQGDDEEDPNQLTSLVLSTVRDCNVEETDRNFCFQVIIFIFYYVCLPAADKVYLEHN